MDRAVVMMVLHGGNGGWRGWLDCLRRGFARRARTLVHTESAPGAESAEQIYDQRDDEDETEAATAIGGASVVKAATTKDEHEQDNCEDKIHALTLPAHSACAYGAFTSNRPRGTLPRIIA
jgi:hypothetical protein